MNERLQEYEEFFNLPSLLICVISPDGKFLKTNIAQRHILGWDPEELIGKPVAEFVHPDDVEPTFAKIAEVLSSSIKITGFKNRCLHKQGGHRWISWSGSARDGLIYAVGTDVTDEVSLSEAVQNERLWLEAVLNELPVPLSFVEPSTGKITFTNAAGHAMAGGTNITQVPAERYDEAYRLTDENDVPIPNEDTPGARRARGEDVKQMELVWHTPVGRFSLLVSSNTLPAQHGHCSTTITAFQDISRLKEVQKELKEAIRARDEFLSIASHELKTPLTTMMLQCQIRLQRLKSAEKEVPNREQLQSMMELDHRQLKRLNRLISDMLDIARISSGKLTITPEPTSFCSLIAGTIDQLQPQAEAAGCSIDLDLCDEFEGQVDAYRLEQVIVNVVTNAIKYAPRSPIHIMARNLGGRFQIVIADQGPGIQPLDQERIFERFERAVGATGVSGLGLGLYISREILRLHGGTIRLESEPGRGSTFTIELPAIPQETPV